MASPPRPLYYDQRCAGPSICRQRPSKAQADELCEQLEARGCTVDFKHVRRTLNGEANKLANEAMDAKNSKLTRAAD